MRIKIFRKLFPVFGLKVYYLLVMDWIIRKRLASQTGIKTRI